MEIQTYQKIWGTKRNAVEKPRFPILKSNLNPTKIASTEPSRNNYELRKELQAILALSGQR